MSNVCDDDTNVIDDQKEARVNEIAASSVRSGLAELELKASEVLQCLENVKTAKSSESKKNEAATGNDKPIVLLQAERKVPADILKSLELLISYSDTDDDSEFSLPALDDVSHLALISHSIVAYLSHLNRQQLIRVTAKISGDTTHWLSSLFRFLDGSSSFHNDNADATLSTVRLAIVARCPGYLEGGIPALAQPCFYISENTTSLRLQYACRQLGIPVSAIRLITTNTTFGTMDLSALQRHIQMDLAAQRTPVLVVADIGDSVCGYVDNLKRLWEICKSHNLWLHASGHGLAALACSQGPGSISSVVDSLTIQLGSWLGVPSLPIVLLHRQEKHFTNAFESETLIMRRLDSLALWTSLQALGGETISERVQIAFQTSSILFEIASKCEGIRVVSRAPGSQTGAALLEVINKPLDFNLLFDAASPLVVFQFDGSVNIKSTETDESVAASLPSHSMNKTIEKIHNASYFDRLNSWLGQILQRDFPNFNFEIIEPTGLGTCIRYCPFELGLGEQPPSADSLEHFAENLESHVDILRATIKHKATFLELVEKSNVLRLVNLPDWAGMGGVRFVPEGWETLLTDQAKTELNKLNMDLVESLKATDNAFSLGEGPDGLICVRFGMVTHETDVDELLDLVVSVGKSVQENSRVLDTMSEIVKKGIETATEDLRRETEEKLWQEGILRHVPVVGRVFNWWSPPPKETGVKGRSLNLTQGVVESTENIYKYHMQLSGMPKTLHMSNKSPPTPMLQAPILTTDTATAQIDTSSPPLSESLNNSVVDEEVNILPTATCPRSASQSSGISSVPETSPALAKSAIDENIDAKAAALAYSNYS